MIAGKEKYDFYVYYHDLETKLLLIIMSAVIDRSHGSGKVMGRLKVANFEMVSAYCFRTDTQNCFARGE